MTGYFYLPSGILFSYRHHFRSCEDHLRSDKIAIQPEGSWKHRLYSSCSPYAVVLQSAPDTAPMSSDGCNWSTCNNRSIPHFHDGVGNIAALIFVFIREGEFSRYRGSPGPVSTPPRVSSTGGRDHFFIFDFKWSSTFPCLTLLYSRWWFFP